MNEGKFSLRIVIGVFAAGLVLGALAAGLCLGGRNSAGRGELRRLAAQAERDLGEARDAQRDAQERALRLEEELRRIAGYAREIESRSGNAEIGAGGIADGLDGAVGAAESLGEGIGRAEDSLEESGRLLTELGSILRGLQTGSGTAGDES